MFTWRPQFFIKFWDHITAGLCVCPAYISLIAVIIIEIKVRERHVGLFQAQSICDSAKLCSLSPPRSYSLRIPVMAIFSLAKCIRSLFSDEVTMSDWFSKASLGSDSEWWKQHTFELIKWWVQEMLGPPSNVRNARLLERGCELFRYSGGTLQGEGGFRSITGFSGLNSVVATKFFGRRLPSITTPKIPLPLLPPISPKDHRGETCFDLIARWSQNHSGSHQV